MVFIKTICFFLLTNCLLYSSSFDPQIRRERFPAMLQRVGKILGECTSLGMHYAGVMRHSKSDRNWPIEFVSNVSIVNLKDFENSEEFEGLSSRDTLKKNQSLHIFIILTYSTSNFQRLVGKLRKTILWDPLAQYLILDDQTDWTGCQHAFAFMNISWAEDLLYSTYFCVDPKDGFTMYTYNPYTRKAPDSWKEIDPFQYTFKNHIWSFFRQRLIPGRTVCQDFNFDKTATMDGHPLNALTFQSGENMQVNLSKPGLHKVYGPEGDMIISALEKLNPTLNLTIIWNSSDYYKYHPRIKNGEWDILLNSQYIFNKPGMTLTYPHEASGIRVLTQFPGYEKQYMRVLTYMNPTLLGLVFLVFAVTSVILFICTRKGLIPSSLEAYRLLLGTVILRSPRRNPLRIYLISVTILFMMTSSVFQSSLSSLLTVHIHKPYIDTEDDLKANPDILVYVYHRYKDVVAGDWIQPRIRPINQSECKDYIKANPRAACAGDQTYLIMDAIHDNFHISRQKLTTLYVGFVVRPNWPLYTRLSFILTVLAQTGIITHLRDRKLVHVMQKWAQMEKEQWSTHVYHVMTIAELTFAFYILVFGLSLATIAFFIELCAGKGTNRVSWNRT